MLRKKVSRMLRRIVCWLLCYIVRDSIPRALLPSNSFWACPGNAGGILGRIVSGPLGYIVRDSIPRVFCAELIRGMFRKCQWDVGSNRFWTSVFHLSMLTKVITRLTVEKCSTFSNLFMLIRKLLCFRRASRSMLRQVYVELQKPYVLQ